MKIKKIEYLLPPQDLVNDCLDVLIFLEDEYCTDNFCYFVEITTPQFLSVLMEKDKSDFVAHGCPYIIVSKLTDEIIRAAIQDFVDGDEGDEDSYWLKLYHLTSYLTIEDINEILYRKKQEDIELDAKTDKEVEEEIEKERESGLNQ